MGFGLDINNKPLEVDKTEWVNYDGIMMPKSTASAKKAWKTRKTKQEKSKYGNREKKQKILQELKQIIIKMQIFDEPVNIISLETSEYNFPKLLPKYNFFIAQNSKKEYLKMLQNKPNNVKMLYYGNVSDFCYIGKKIDYAFLDFCCTFNKAEKIISDLSVQLNGCKLIALSFCLRKNQKNIDDYRLDLSNKLFSILPKFRFFKFFPYRDKNHAPMMTMFLHNIEEEVMQYTPRCEEYPNLYEERLCVWVKEKIRKEYPKIYKKIDEEKSHNISKIFSDEIVEYYKFENTKLFFQKFFKDALKEFRFFIPKLEYFPTGSCSVAKRVFDFETCFEYFVKTIVFQLPNIWDKKLDKTPFHQYYGSIPYFNYDEDISSK